ncbi:MAG: diaminopimelate decarboxylase [Candidatus Omnitrophica bacterium]|nr:diaminopimelate decarboxylase [Candidatus Omnitrophota bacterium]MBU1810044.1 diaminopimelate decarboxylase [Candidatus Omnitrophota bacterium]
MHHFKFRRNNLFCENVKIKDLAEKYNTPLYIYSAKTILDHFSKIETAFSAIKPLICYSAKANSNLAILKLLVDRGAGLDIVSGGELYRAKKIKCSPGKVVYASVGKTEQEIAEAINYGIKMFNVESVDELKRINEIAGALRKKVSAAIRINPDIDPKTHKYITTAKLETKFGIDIITARDIFLNRKVYPHLNIAGIHLHIGSQITQSAPFIRAITKIKHFIKGLERKKVNLKYLNIGGGLGIVYDKEKPQTVKDFASRVLPLLKEIGLKVILEPGRFIVGNAGILVAKVIYIKDTPVKKFIIVDAGMNDLIRPSLYDAYHKIIPLEKPSAISHQLSAIKMVDVVGPICETADFLGKSRRINVKQGDCLAVLGAGAYGFSMSSNYNSRPRAAEVLVKNNKSYLIRKRETYRDLVKREEIC